MIGGTILTVFTKKIYFFLRKHLLTFAFFSHFFVNLRKNESHQRNYVVLNLLYDISTKTSKYIKQPLKLSDTDHASSVADITNQKEKSSNRFEKSNFWSFFL